MTAEAKQKVCIHCRRPEAIKQVGVVEGDQEVGVIYCCRDCQARMEGYALDLFLYDPDEKRSQQNVH